MSDLNAEFNRWNISNKDFEEAHAYLKILDPKMDETIQRGLLSAAIVAYGRPFKGSQGLPKAAPSIEIPEGLFDAAEMALHEKIIRLRDKGIAHSDFELKPTSRVPITGSGFMTWSKPFNPLYEGIDIDRFRDMAWRLHCQCASECMRRNRQLNEADGHPAPSDGVVTSLTIPHSDFLPKKKH